MFPRCKRKISQKEDVLWSERPQIYYILPVIFMDCKVLYGNTLDSTLRAMKSKLISSLPLEIPVAFSQNILFCFDQSEWRLDLS